MDPSGTTEEETLLVEKLVSGDRPSVLAAGMYAAAALKQDGMAVLMVDALGRVHLMPKASIEVVSVPKVDTSDLDNLEEDLVIEVLLRQGSEEEEIIEYLRKRNSNKEGQR
jgi:hypothetical protein